MDIEEDTELLREGTFGEIRVLRHNQSMVIKKPKNNAVHFLMNEITMMGSLYGSRHLLLPDSYMAVQGLDYVCPVFNKATCDLIDIIYRMKDSGVLNTFSVRHDFLMDIYNSIASGLSFMHSRGILHRDIKPDNILIMPGGSIRICDFGLATWRDPMGMDRGQAGTFLFMAPEVTSYPQTRLPYDGTLADVFSMGKTLKICAEWIDLLHLPAIILDMINFYPCIRPSIPTVMDMLNGDGVGSSNVLLKFMKQQ